MPAANHAVSVAYAEAGTCPAGTVPTTWLSDDMESGSGWTHSAAQGVDAWVWTAARYTSPNNSWHGGAGFTDSTQSDQSLVSPAVSLPAAASNPVLSYYNWRDLEANGALACWDGAVLEYTTNGGTNWLEIPATSFLSDAYDHVITTTANPVREDRGVDVDAWCGIQDWTLTEVDLSGLEGSTLQFRFRIGTDNSIRREGWYIDDVVVAGCALILKKSW